MSCLSLLKMINLGGISNATKEICILVYPRVISVKRQLRTIYLDKAVTITKHLKQVKV